MVTSDKDGLDSEFERELPDAPPAALGGTIPLNAGGQPPAESSNQKVSELTGAVHKIATHSLLLRSGPRIPRVRLSNS